MLWAHLVLLAVVARRQPASTVARRTVEVTADDVARGGAIVPVLRRVWPDFDSDSAARKAVRRGRIAVDGARARTTTSVRPGATLSELARADAGAFAAKNAPGERAAAAARARAERAIAAVAYEDDELAVVVKRSGVSTVRAPGDAPGAPTVQSALPSLLAPSRAGARDALWRPRVCHRLDKPTHGLVLCAKTERARRALSRALEERRVEKRYRAVVVAGERLASAGAVATPLGGRAARTAFRVVRRARAATLVDLRPRTGRTHQLRRHCAEQLGCGIVGDERYSSGGLPESPAVRPLARAGGLFLAAVELKLRHPTTGALLHVEIDEPPRFAALLDALDGADVDSSGGGGA